MTLLFRDLLRNQAIYALVTLLRRSIKQIRVCVCVCTKVQPRFFVVFFLIYELFISRALPFFFAQRQKVIKHDSIRLVVNKIKGSDKYVSRYDLFYPKSIFYNEISFFQISRENGHRYFKTNLFSSKKNHN